ncbi:tRNA (mnm(5)s(2)U34)-methyltransferase [Anaerobacillus isosaccharinicus]|uniref:16S rRNA (Cytosine(1402)-N(4))-methyltransferase n=1 Tax=Anaerobacillus isosaccharinicus TaxID=1532552 RepID=A0A1S2KVU7_9BACI|nr:class I SAM-dependent methyltransferase [Anaerobacillus isosaccharinicus]MBA5588084.1 class I SAM-dependent methyltransferase [Anaerobacillus isosaccharinicus]QOY33777.1 class I SAM-dependent methyltransferase [Anaerobacillus isosaccharinicus]
MKVLGILPFARQLLINAISNGDSAIDGTAGNGHDTLFLAQLVGDLGRVYGFDIQEAAIRKTKERLIEHGALNQVSLFQSGHQEAKNLIPENDHGNISGAIFNLGYLPGGDKSIVTKPETTLKAIADIFSLLKKGGIIVLVIYHGHEEGRKEKDVLLNYVSSIDQAEGHVLTYQFLNQKNNPPFIVAIEKR